MRIPGFSLGALGRWVIGVAAVWEVGNQMPVELSVKGNLRGFGRDGQRYGAHSGNDQVTTFSADDAEVIAGTGLVSNGFFEDDLPRSRQLAENNTATCETTLVACVDALAVCTGSSSTTSDESDVGDIIIGLVSASGVGTLVSLIVSNVRLSCEQASTKQKDYVKKEKENSYYRALMDSIPLDKEKTHAHWREATSLFDAYRDELLFHARMPLKTELPAWKDKKLGELLTKIMLENPDEFNIEKHFFGITYHLSSLELTEYQKKCIANSRHLADIQQLLDPNFDPAKLVKQGQYSADMDPHILMSVSRVGHFDMFPNTVLTELDVFYQDPSASRIVAVRSPHNRGGYGRSAWVAHYYLQSPAPVKCWLRAHSEEALIESMVELAQREFRRQNPRKDNLPSKTRYEWIHDAKRVLLSANLIVCTQIRDLSLLQSSRFGLIDASGKIYGKSENRQIVLVVGLHTRWVNTAYPEVTIPAVPFKQCYDFLNKTLLRENNAFYRLWQLAKGVPLQIVLAQAVAKQSTRINLNAYLDSVEECQRDGVVVPLVAAASVDDRDNGVANEGGADGDEERLTAKDLMPENPMLACFIVPMLSYLEVEHPSVMTVLKRLCGITDYILDHKLIKDIIATVWDGFVQDYNTFPDDATMDDATLDDAYRQFIDVLNRVHLLLPSPPTGIIIRPEVLKVLCVKTHSSSRSHGLEDLIPLVMAINKMNIGVFKSLHLALVEEQLQYTQSVEHLVVLYADRFAHENIDVFVEFLRSSASFYILTGKIWHAYGLLKIAYEHTSKKDHFIHWMRLHAGIAYCQLGLGYAQRSKEKLEEIKGMLNERMEVGRDYLTPWYTIIQLQVLVSLCRVHIQLGEFDPVTTLASDARALLHDPESLKDIQTNGMTFSVDTHTNIIEMYDAISQFMNGKVEALHTLYHRTRGMNAETTMYVVDIRYWRAYAYWYQGYANYAESLLLKMRTYTQDPRVNVLYALILKTRHGQTSQSEATRLLLDVVNKPEQSGSLILLTQKMFSNGKGIPVSPLLSFILKENIRAMIHIEPWLYATLQLMPDYTALVDEKLWEFYEKIVVRYASYRIESQTAELVYIVMAIDALERYLHLKREHVDAQDTADMKQLLQIVERSRACIENNILLDNYINQQLESYNVAINMTMSVKHTPTLRNRHIQYSARSRLASYLAPLASSQLQGLLRQFSHLEIPQWLFDCWRFTADRGHPCEHWLVWVDKILQLKPPVPPRLDREESADQSENRGDDIDDKAVIEAKTTDNQSDDFEEEEVLDYSTQLKNYNDLVDLSFAMLVMHIIRTGIYACIPIAREAIISITNTEIQRDLRILLQSWDIQGSNKTMIQESVFSGPLTITDTRKNLRDTIKKFQSIVVEEMSVSPRRVFSDLQRARLYSRASCSSRSFARLLSSQSRGRGNSATQVDDTTDDDISEGGAHSNDGVARAMDFANV